MNVGSENEMLENKESLSQLDKGIKSMTAMLNKHYHGIVYFGTYDNGDVKGVQLGKRSLDDIRERISLLVQPRFSYEVEVLKDENGMQYVKLEGNGNDTPYSCDGRYYIRNVKSDDLMDNNMVRRAVMGGKFDALKESSSPNQSPSFNYLCSYFINNSIHATPGKMLWDNYGLLNSEGKYNLVAYLLSDRNDVSIKVVRFNGISKSSMSERTEFGNRSLLSSCQAVLDYISSQNSTKVDLSKGKRKETPLFDFESFREAWINACVHNDWLHMIPPAVFIYDDRLEVSSYGQLPFNMTKEDFFAGRSRPINLSLFKIFTLSDFAEQSGHGVPIIVSKYTEKAFDFSQNMVLVTIPFSFTPDSVVTRRKIYDGNLNLIESHQQILEYFASHPYASLAETAAEVGMSVPGVKKAMKSLQEKGLIHHVGPSKGGKWEI